MYEFSLVVMKLLKKLKKKLNNNWLNIPRTYNTSFFIIIFIVIFLVCTYYISSSEDIEYIDVKNIKQKYIVTVEILGNVKKPGVYKLPKGKKLYDLIEIAGGNKIKTKKTKVKNYWLKDYKVYYIKY